MNRYLDSASAFALCACAALSLSQTACQQDGKAARLPAKPEAAAKPAEPVASGTKPAAAVVDQTRPEKTQALSANTTALMLTATTEAFRNSTLSATVSGKVVRVTVREGSKVKLGQVLVQLDAADYRLRLKAAQAALKVAQAQLNATRIEWKRLAGLVKDRAIPRSQFEQAEAQFEVGKAGVAQARVSVEMARKALRDTSVRAPFDGVVTRLSVHRGEYAVTTPPTDLVTVKQIDRLDLRIQVPETAINRVRQGTPVRARFVALNRTLTAPIARVVESLDAQTRSFSAIVELDNTKRLLRPGMFAEVRIAGPTVGATKEKKR